MIVMLQIYFLFAYALLNWILHNCFQNQRVKWGAGMMIMNEFNHSVIKSEIEKFLKNVQKKLGKSH
ncbi:hypothetical protein E4K43_11720 [Neisseria meningitidis]|nr:hypothetical protein [Neisseria meningitidis]